MRILILGAFNAGALENYYLKGLTLAGADCSTFDITNDYYKAIKSSLVNKVTNKIIPDFFFEAINKKLFQFLFHKQFDVILVFKGLTLYESTVEKLKSHTKILSCYNPDHPFRFFSPGSGNKHIIKSINYYDIYFTYAKKICQQLKQDWGAESYAIPFGYDDFERTNTMSVNDAYKNKWLFIGTYDKERMAWLRKIDIEGLNIYGDAKWSKNDDATNAYQGKPLYDDEYKTAIQNASGIINLLRKQNIEECSHNMRTFEVPGYGGLLIANSTEEQKSFFEENEEAIFFENSEELNAKLHFLSRNEHVVTKMKRAAKIRSEKSGYGYSYRSKQLYQILSDHF